MKRWIAALSAIVLLFALCACGKTQQPQTEPSVSATEAPSEGRISEKDSYFVHIPENWCKMEYTDKGSTIRLFNTRSAKDIEDDTEEIMIEMASETSQSTDAEVQALLQKTTAHEDEARTIDGYTFRCVIYTHPEGRRYTVLVGLVDGHVTTVTLKGLYLDRDKTAQSVVDSITFK